MNTSTFISLSTKLPLTNTLKFVYLAIFFCAFCFFNIQSVQADIATSQSVNFSEKVNINIADASELSAKLIGIGESKANAIVQYREQMGDFASVADLVLVKGIGEKTLADNRYLLSVDNE